MVTLNVEKILEEKGLSHYWLWKRLEISNYTNFNNFIKNRTYSIQYELIGKLCKILECEPNDLFTIVDDE